VANAGEQIIFDLCECSNFSFRIYFSNKKSKQIFIKKIVRSEIKMKTVMMEWKIIISINIFFKVQVEMKKCMSYFRIFNYFITL